MVRFDIIEIISHLAARGGVGLGCRKEKIATEGGC